MSTVQGQYNFKSIWKIKKVRDPSSSKTIYLNLYKIDARKIFLLSSFLLKIVSYKFKCFIEIVKIISIKKLFIYIDLINKLVILALYL